MARDGSRSTGREHRRLRGRSPSPGSSAPPPWVRCAPLPQRPRAGPTLCHPDAGATSGRSRKRAATTSGTWAIEQRQGASRRCRCAVAGSGARPVRPGPGASRLAMPVPGGGAPCCVLGCPLRGTSLFDESWDGWRTGGPPSSWRPDAASPRTWHRCPSLWSLDGSACRSSTWPAHRWPRPAPATSGLPWLGLMPRPLISGCREMARWRIACACPPAWRLGLVALHFRFT